VCAEAAEAGIAEAANYNSPLQIVIAGNTAGVNRAMEIAKARGAKRTVLLAMSVPSHCSLMRPAPNVCAVRSALWRSVRPRFRF
jgi:[acyl-carrier-protein] S-malonyltransferase